MNKQKFVEYLRSPKDLDKESFAQLKELVKEYPYFQSGRTLLAKASKNLKSKNAPIYISSAAVYATDRALLKRYINDELIFLSPLTVHESHEADHDRDLDQVIKTNRIAAAKTKLSGSEPKKEQKSRIPKKPVSDQFPQEGYLSMDDLKSETPSELDHIIEELYRDMEELKINRAKLKDIEDKLTEEEAVDLAVKKATEKKTNPENLADSPEVPKKEIGEIKKLTESRSARVSKINQEIEISKSLTDQKSSEKKEEPKAKASPSKSAEANKTSVSSPKTKTPAKTKTTTSKKSTSPENPSDDNKSTDNENNKDDKGDPLRKEQEHIIDDFIRKNPSITPAEKVFYDDDQEPQPDLSGNSTELHPEIASEYLAEIYLEQGRLERAFQIYEALMVRFPEKSLYFADIIKKLNEKS